MITSPFKIFEPFQDRLSIRFFSKADDIQTDADLPLDRVASLRQVHGNRTVILREASNRTEEADGIITDQANLWLSIRAADCQQLIIYAPEAHVCGVIHAGWKGLKAEVIRAFFKTLEKTFGIQPSQTYVGIGPSLCEQCAEFTDPYRELEGLNTLFINGRNANLQAIADSQLDGLGIPRSQRERHADCTKCMSDIYWSYRGGDKEKVLSGYCNILVCRMNNDW